ncbi:multidrug ABC transporter ATPase [Pseudorhodoferax aquiterrae]|uniref:Multidrug ABC transporter ATPase n=2 Tax=Pseudorhodoferax aquiterrae TaxID=747304 RepID=A0ABQ3G789_9BURK|nr:multidrug ABC transporter ATPase [Pseudorhodoferax aquiterrae]
MRRAFLVCRMPPPSSAPLSPSTPAHAARELYAALWRHAEGARGQLAGAMALLGGAQVVRLAMPWLAAQGINALQRGELQGAARWIVALLGIYLVSWLMHGPGRVLERNVAVHVREQLGDRLYARIAGAPLAWHGSQHSGELQHRVHQASRALADFAQNQFVYLQNIVNFFGPLIALTLLSRSSGALALGGYVLIAAVVLRFDRALMLLARQENDADRRYVAALVDFIGNTATVIGLRLASASRALMRLRMRAVSGPLRRATIVGEGKWFTVDILGLALTWGLVVLYVWQTRRPGEAVLLGGVFMIYQYAQQTATVIGSMAGNFQSFARMHTDYRSAEPLLAAPQRADEAAERLDAGATWQELALRGLHWHYADSARGHGLRAVDLQLARGQRVALVGASGGGKSTLLRVLAGLYPPASGQLLFDGQAGDWPRLRNIATLIPQETEVFEASVRENLAFGLPRDDADLLAAVHTSAFDEVLAGLQGDLDTPLTERGANLSGGQRQRLCLARGVLSARGSSLLLLDEPTSALDPATEARVLDRIADAFPDACVIASIHRMSLLSHFDQIVVMEAGRVRDAGPREEVLARQPQLRAADGRPAPHGP